MSNIYIGRGTLKFFFFFNHIQKTHCIEIFEITVNALDLDMKILSN